MPTEFAATGKATTLVRSESCALEVVVVEREVVRHVDEADDDPEVVLQLEPRRHVRVVVELRHEHLVARAQRPREGAREQEVEAVMLGPNATSSGSAAEEVGRTSRARAR